MSLPSELYSIEEASSTQAYYTSASFKKNHHIRETNEDSKESTVSFLTNPKKHNPLEDFEQPGDLNSIKLNVDLNLETQPEEPIKDAIFHSKEENTFRTQCPDSLLTNTFNLNQKDIEAQLPPPVSIGQPGLKPEPIIEDELNFKVPSTDASKEQMTESEPLLVKRAYKLKKKGKPIDLRLFRKALPKIYDGIRELYRQRKWVCKEFELGPERHQKICDEENELKKLVLRFPKNTKMQLIGFLKHLGLLRNYFRQEMKRYLPSHQSEMITDLMGKMTR